jgi:hypothetical protein
VKTLNYHNGGRWLKGPAFADWLEARLPARPKGEWPDTIRRRVWQWRKDGESVDLYNAEVQLVKVDIHPSEIPDELWTRKAPKRLCRCGCGGQVAPGVMPQLLPDHTTHRRKKAA